MTPATDDAAFVILAKPILAKTLLELGVLAARRHLDDDVNVLGGPRLRCRRIGDPESNRGATNEDDVVDQASESRARNFEEGNAHASSRSDSRSRNSPFASSRTRASPTRMPSTSASISYTHASDSASDTAAG